MGMQQVHDDCASSAQHLCCVCAQELQDVNRKQLAVLRQLSQEHEQERAALRAGVEAEARDVAARLGAELDELKAQRERQEVLS